MIHAVILTKSIASIKGRWGVCPIAYDLENDRIIRIVGGNNGLPLSHTAANRFNAWDIINVNELSAIIRGNQDVVAVDADSFSIVGKYEKSHEDLLDKLAMPINADNCFMKTPDSGVPSDCAFTHSVEFHKVSNLTITQISGIQNAGKADFIINGKHYWNYVVRDLEYDIRGKKIARWRIGDAYVAFVLPSNAFKGKFYKYISGIFPLQPKGFLPGDVESTSENEDSLNYSASYTGNNPDFCIYGFPATSKKIPVIQHSFTCIVRNILSRSRRVNPSQKLVELLEAANLNDPDTLDTIIRYQFILLEMLEKGQLLLTDEEWHLQSSHEIILKIAAEDLLEWLKNLYCLAGINFSSPLIDAYSGWMIENNPVNGEIAPQTIATVSVASAGADDWYSVSCGENINYNIEQNVSDSKLESMRYLLKNIFGYDDFNQGQLQIIVNILNRKRTIGIMPTGGGKSLCYQYAAILQPGVSLSVCPLSSLEQDQKDNLDRLGFDRTSLINSDQSRSGKEQVMKHLSAGKYQIIWISPERFQTAEFRNHISHLHTVSYAVVDEVHCLSEWGHDFRTSYLTLVSSIEAACPTATLVGLTATASQAVLKDLKIEFNVDAYGVRALPSLQRENLRMQVINASDDKLDKLEDLLKNEDMVNSDTLGIVFTVYSDKSGDKDASKGSFRLLDDIQRIRPDLISEKYHAKIKDKTGVLDRFKNDEINILSSTKAFGMGINKDDIRYTIHYGLPWSVEAFYQEAGRAGRGQNNIAADCFIIYKPEDASVRDATLRLFERNTTPEEIGAIVDGYGRSLNDVGNIFFLWLKNNKGVEADLNNLIAVNELVDSAPHIEQTDGNIACVIESNWKIPADVMELALYRLKLLGKVTDWTIEWKCSYNVFVCTLSEAYTDDVAEEYMFRYIRRYDPTFAKPWTGDNNRYKEILDAKDIAPLQRYMKVILTWSYDNIIFSRRRMIYNIKRFCEGYSDSDTFRRLIDDFLRISDSGVILDGIINEPEDWEPWFSIFYPKDNTVDGEAKVRMLSSKECEAIHETTARYLESYKNITGLNLIYCLSGILSSRYDIDIDHEIMDAVLSDLVEKYPKSEENILKRLDVFLDDNYERSNKEQFDDVADCIVNTHPEKARDYYNKYRNYYSAKIMLANYKNRIISAMGRINQ